MYLAKIQRRLKKAQRMLAKFHTGSNHDYWQAQVNLYQAKTPSRNKHKVPNVNPLGVWHSWGVGKQPLDKMARGVVD